MSDRGATYRTFIAVELPAALRELINRHIDHLRRQLPEVHAGWSRADNLHLTLKFLGNVPVAQIAALSTAIEACAQRTSQIELVLSGCGAFPPRGQPKVLWIGIDDPSGKLTRLQERIEDKCAELGFEKEVRPFHPHLTIARLRKPSGARLLAEAHKEIGFESRRFPVCEIVVFRSELLREGSKHTAVSRHPLR